RYRCQPCRHRARARWWRIGVCSWRGVWPGGFGIIWATRPPSAAAQNEAHHTSAGNPMNDTPLLLSTRPQSGVALPTLNRPQAPNALSIGLREALVRTLREIAADGTVRAVVMTGAGRGFCAGLDLKELGERGLVPSNADNDVAAALAAMPQPVIGAINGVAI